MDAPALVASDIDGTLITSMDRVPDRLRDVIARAEAAGTEVALATGRPHRWIHTVLEQLTIRPVCVTSNGAVLYDSDADRVLDSHVLPSEVMTQVHDVAATVLAQHGGVTVAAERVGVSSFDAPEDVFVIEPDYLHTWEEQGFGVMGTADVLREPAVKMILRNDGMTAPEMYKLISPHVDPALATVTYSMNEGLLEIAAPGVTKALGVSTLADMHGVEQSQTIAFGDMPNDIAMLQWVGHGVAMGNAADPVKDVADEITGTNNDAGVAMVLERWF